MTISGFIYIATGCEVLEIESPLCDVYFGSALSTTVFGTIPSVVKSLLRLPTGYEPHLAWNIFINIESECALFHPSSWYSVSNFYMTDYTSQGWKPVGKKGWTCLACWDHRTHVREHLRRHERTEKHMSAVQHHHATQQGGFNEGGHGLDDAVKIIHDQSMLGVGLILDEMSTSMVDHLVGEGFVTSTDPDSGDADNQFQQSLTEKSQTQIAAAPSNFLGEDELSDEGRYGDQDVTSEVGMEDAFTEAGSGSGRLDNVEENEWFPWPNKLHQVDLLTWLLHINVRTLKILEDGLQNFCGIETLPFAGAFGHKYHMNSFSDIIAQEMTNPHGFSKLHFYPEDSGKQPNEAYQAQRWWPGLHAHKMVSTQRDVFCQGHREIEISEAEFLVSFKNWGVSQSTFALPPAQNIMGIEKSCQGGLQLEPWTLTKPHEGNQWHALANGAHCWNKHNSFLFTPAGLSCAAVHQEYNVHFLCTSNTAPPLEMLDGFVNQMELKTGIWAWDCIHKEKVLVLPSVLALLGDNPMQNEQTQECSGGERSDGQNSVRSGEEGFTPGTRKLRGKAKETMADMVAHIKWFVNKEQSIDELKSMFTMASSIGNQTKIKNIKTSTGLKDRYLDYFLDEMASSYKKKHGNSSKQQALEEFVQKLPNNVYSPVWHIKDTPVEVLHTVLLGFVKYFWRDAVNIRIGKNKIKKELLETCLSSFDTTGLEIPPLSGHTLVQYAGSLVALSKLIPLIWQSEIDDIDVHLNIFSGLVQQLCLQLKHLNHLMSHPSQKHTLKPTITIT
ncbi:hypothetical protein EDC04DRAFT_2605807 [Pisolithus marmoratus]|nr:hypothetical protein EDC04DRAFT_2605807 [Pisolithus marmoratus]